MPVTLQADAVNKAITDGDLMNCCLTDITPEHADGSMTQVRKTAESYRYEEVNPVNYEYTTCYDPSLVDSSIRCPKDLKGNSQYACFPPLGEQMLNCRSSCIYGHPQSNERTLFDHYTETGMPLTERGVELYENYGLDQTLRRDSGRYGDDDFIGCITDYGRKLTIYGFVHLRIYLKKMVSYHATTPPIPVDDMYYNFEHDTVYEVVIPRDVSSVLNGVGYKYFGNSGIVFTYPSNGTVKKYSFIPNKDGIMYYPNGTEVPRARITYRSQDADIYYIFDTYANPDFIPYMSAHFSDAVNFSFGNVFVGNSIQPKYDDDTNCGDNTKKPVPLFPVSYRLYDDNKSYTCNSGHKDTGVTPTPLDCHASGVKSIYIPPHMGITDITYINSSKTVSSTDGTFFNEHSVYKNGTFHAVGSKGKPPTFKDNDNLNADDNDYLMDNRNPVLQFPPGSLGGLSTFVRQDDSFYKRVIAPYVNQFAPEIFLIPGIENALNFSKNITLKSADLLNDLQLIRQAPDFWDPTKNKYCDGSSYVTLNLNYHPGEVLYRPTDIPPIANAATVYGSVVPGTITLDGKTITCTPVEPEGKKSKKSPTMAALKDMFIDHPLNILEAYGKQFWQMSDALVRTYSFAEVETVSPYFRIEGFSPYNGIYSIEWLYVLYNCAMIGRKNLSVINKEYVFNTNCTYNCGQECMYFRDPSKYCNTPGASSSPDTMTDSDADIFMQIYCGMRNLSSVYVRWQQETSTDTNVCACLSNGDSCSALGIGQSCDYSTNNVNTYVPAGQACRCQSTNICTNCETKVFQAVIAFAGGCNSNVNTSDNSNTMDIGDTCASSNCINDLTVEVGEDGNGDGSDDVDVNKDDAVDQATSIIGLIILLVIIVGVIIVVIAGVLMYRKKKKAAATLTVPVAV
jgi:hypothetical protein